jgi:DNA-binding CsgD family transcriptional regulator
MALVFRMIELLTPRQVEVMRLTVDGYSKQDIADILGITLRSVKGIINKAELRAGIPSNRHKLISLAVGCTYDFYPWLRLNQPSAE